MKMKKYVFSSLLMVCGMGAALASDCTGSGCDFDTTDYTDTIARIEELLGPQLPMSNVWVINNFNVYSSDHGDIALDVSDGCPFDTESECEIWRRKPTVRETVSPRSPTIRSDMMDSFITAARYDTTISANDSVATPLLDRYKMLMRTANACCTDGFVYSLKRAGASDGLVYRFMVDDANFYGLGARCLMMTDDELDKKYPHSAMAAMAADIRNGCLCRGRQWFAAMLAPFKHAYEAVPEFATQGFFYTYTDGLNRQITVSVNDDVQNVLNQLELCP